MNLFYELLKIHHFETFQTSTCPMSLQRAQHAAHLCQVTGRNLASQRQFPGIKFAGIAGWKIPTLSSKIPSKLGEIFQLCKFAGAMK